MLIKRLLIFFLIIFLLSILSIYYPKLTGKVVSEGKADYEPEQVFVSCVIDGDTIESDIGKIRLLGVNAPERGKTYCNEAKDFLKQIENKSVLVLGDFEDEDRYGRKLRYAFYNGRLLNVEILEQGLGTLFMIENLKYEDKLINAESFARDNEIRLWEKSFDECASCIELVELNPIDEFFILENKCGFDCDLDGWTVKDNANHIFKLDELNAEKQKKYNSKGHVWNNDRDRFFMRDGGGRLVLFYDY